MENEIQWMPYEKYVEEKELLDKALHNIFIKGINSNNTKFMYHKTIGFPKDIVIPDKIFNLGYTNHAKSRVQERIGGVSIKPTLVRLTSDNLIEIHTDDNKTIKKAVVKLNYDKKRDIILVMELKHDIDKAVVITLYYNSKHHSFETLDKTKYNVPNA